MNLIQSRAWRAVARIAAVVGLAALSACASPPARFYTLGTDREPTRESVTVSPAFWIDMRVAKVPVSVARSQIVVQVDAARVRILEDERWASPLADELRNALLAAATRPTGRPDTFQPGHAEDARTYQVSVDVQRFESWPGSHALIDVTWSVRKSNDSRTLTCRSIVSQPVSAGYDALVNGHRVAVRRIGTQIGDAVREFSASAIVSATAPARIPAGTGGSALSCPALAG
ncbi:hypothetical protein B0G80_7106 [Paraburkholderia sp. BL6669N2]|uniref:PqiC family protein n=1 Tax=Paraburkholderia sp. BL6669N2 TaxID=1938807 RepID=UPI000E385EE7|nr:PqiC family protein [Paraburkholderia sp. BL6669N2]REG50657.1 hypothetical protein B0G80_7106 [Paraburkholderia sp. BL6669N2]